MRAASPRHLAPRWARLLASLALVAAIWACNTPYIPVPPAAAPSFMAVTISEPMGERTLYEAHGAPFELGANAKFFIYNKALEIGVITKAAADGSYVAPLLDGKLGDPIEVFYQTPKGDVSPPLCRKLAEGIPTEPCE